MTALDRRLLTRFVRLAGDRLTGDWVVMGGIVLPLLGVEHRVTVDIDLAGPADATNAETFALMEIAERLGLAPESINQAGAHFLHRVRGWQDDLVLLHQGRRARLHRPGVTLFVLLKLSRLSETDLADCRAMLEWARDHDERPDRRRLARAIRKALRERPTAARAEKLERLLAALED